MNSCVNAHVLRGTASLLPNNRYANSMVVLLPNLAMMRYNQSLKAQLWDWTLRCICTSVLQINQQKHFLLYYLLTHANLKAILISMTQIIDLV